MKMSTEHLETYEAITKPVELTAGPDLERLNRSLRPRLAEADDK